MGCGCKKKKATTQTQTFPNTQQQVGNTNKEPIVVKIEESQFTKVKK
jgi:hypothetical protein